MTQAIPTPQDRQRLVRMLKALGNPVRFRIIEYLATHPTCMTQAVVLSTPLAQSTVSQHLKVLREAGLIQGEIEGAATCYCLDPQGVRWLEERFGGWLQRLDPESLAGSPGIGPAQHGATARRTILHHEAGSQE
jgi:ArsR family transcriptional regulator, arsenate/arsenite/antimonite-responsive transcriptional repressor